VSVQDLERRFGDFVAVNRLTFRVAPGEIFGFLGPNGAGKSTTIRMLCGILRPSAGSGSVAGLDIMTQTERIKEHIGYMSQRFSLYEDLTVEENIAFYGGVYRIPAATRAARREWVLGMAGLRDHRHVRTGLLAGGWKQRLALGCAILHEPPILFLDEPTAGVDPASRRQFWDLIHRLAEQGVTVFVTTHYMDEAEYCDRLGLIYRGELIALGTPGELKSHGLAGGVLEVTCDHPQEALAVVEAIPGIREAARFGRDVHALADEPAALVSAVRTALEAAGQRVDRVEVTAPCLEDVFVSLIEARDRAERPSAREVPR